MADCPVSQSNSDRGGEEAEDRGNNNLEASSIAQTESIGADVPPIFAWNSSVPRDYWNQSLKLNLNYEGSRLLQDETSDALLLDEQALEQEQREEEEQERRKSSAESSQVENDEDEDEDEAEADERAIDEVIGLDEEFAGEDEGASRMHAVNGANAKQVDPSTTATLSPFKRRCHIFTWSNFGLAFRFLIALAFIVSAVAVNPQEEWSGISVWRWCTFLAVVVLSWDFSSRIIVAVVLLILSKYWYSSDLVKNMHYYLFSVRYSVSLLLCSIIWILSWWSIIGLARPQTETWGVTYDYVTRAFGVVIVWVFLVTVAGICKEFAESLFERSTHWNDVERMLKCEYFLWRLASQGSLFPHEVVSAFALAGWRATKSDPKVLRQCTRYISKTAMTAFDASGEPLQINDMDEAADFGVLLFNRVSESQRDDVAGILRSMQIQRLERQRQIPKAYGYMLHGRSRMGSHTTVPLPSEGSTGSTVPMPREPKHPKHLMNDPRKLKYENVEMAYTPYGSLPDYAPDALYGWTHVLDTAQRGHGSARSFRAAMIRFFQDRANVAATLRDAHAAVERLGFVFLAVANILALVIAALIFAGSASYEVWLGLTSFFVAMAVIFGSMLAQVFENIVFLFFRHVFDVGDLIMIADDYYSVRRLELLSTLLLKWSGQYMLVENSWLARQQVLNLTRSGLYWQEINAAVDIATCTPEFVHGVKSCIKQYVVKHPESFSGEFQVCMSGMERPLHVVLSLWIEHSWRPNNLERLFADIGRAHEAMCLALRTNGATTSGVNRGSIHMGKATAPQFLSTSSDPGMITLVKQINQVQQSINASSSNARGGSVVHNAGSPVVLQQPPPPVVVARPFPIAAASTNTNGGPAPVVYPPAASGPTMVEMSLNSASADGAVG